MPDFIAPDKECPIPKPFRANIGPLFFMAGLFFLTFTGRFIFAPLMPTIEKDLGITHAQAGSLFFFISIGMFVAQINSGFISSRINHKGSLFVSTLGIGLPLLAIYFLNDLWAIRVALFVVGMAAGLHMPSTIPTITAMVDRQDWGKALGVHGTAPPLALILCPFLVIIFINWYSWQTMVMAMGVVISVAAFVFLKLFHCGEFPGDIPRPGIVKIAFAQPSFWIMVVLFAIFLGGSIGIYTMLPLYLVNEIGFSEGFANSIIGLSRLSGLFITFLSGIMMDRIGEKRHITIAFVAAGISTILIGSTSGTWLIVMLFIQPAIIGCFPIAGFSALSRIVQPSYRSVATAFAPPIAFLIGGGLMPMILGYMGQAYSFSLGIIIIGCLIIASSFLAIPLQLIEHLEEGC